MNIPPKYEDVVAELEAALKREAALREELEGSPDVSIKNCIFEGENRDGSQAFEFEISEGRLNKLTKINLDGWLCYGPSGGNPIDALQKRLTAADQRADDLEDLLRGALRHVPHYGKSDWKGSLRHQINEALKPAEDPFGVLAETGMTYPEFMRSTFQERHKLTDAECEEFHVWKKNRGKPAAEGEGS